MAKQTGFKAVELVTKQIKPRDIMTKKAFNNAIALDMALGGSTNTTLHLPAIAYYADVDITLKDFNKLAVRWADNDYSFWCNGVEIDSNTTGTLPVGMNKVQFNRSGTNDFPLYGKCRAVETFDYLTDEEMILLTT